VTVKRRRVAPSATAALAELRLLLRRVLDEPVGWVRDHRVDAVGRLLPEPV
jgi:hypothetical protein